MSESLDLKNIYHKLGVQLNEQYLGIIEKFPLDEYVTTLNEGHAFVGYSVVSDKIFNLCDEISHDYTQEALDLYHRILLLHLLLANWNEMHSGRFSVAVQGQFQRECCRISDEVESNQIGFYTYNNDLFRKDLAVAMLRMFPAGVLKVECLAGIPNRIVLSNKGRDVMSWFRLLLRTGGFSPFYEIHLDIRYRDEFNPEGWDAALQMIGEMLIYNPQIKGITGASWFFDPQIRSISPRLNYLRERAEKNGGCFFFYKKENHTTELAIASSPTRRKLFEDGSYKPVSYFMVWPRADILQWIHRSAYRLYYYR